MATLADLFEPHKSVIPDQQEETSQEATPTGAFDIGNAKARAQQLNQFRQLLNADLFTEPTDETTVDLHYKVKDFVPTGEVVTYDRGNLAEEVKDLCARNGINIVVTSGRRKAGDAGRAGAASFHVSGNAVDIIPGEGESFDSIKTKMLSNPEILQFFYENGLGIIDETKVNTMKKTGATGKHFHIGPDSMAVQTWQEWVDSNTSNPTVPLKYLPQEGLQREWTNNMYNAYLQGLKDEYGRKYDESTYERIATYMTYQSALESGYGQHANGYNYGGHKRLGETIHYDSMDSYVKAQMKTMRKWPIMQAKSLEDFVYALYYGDYQYNPSATPAQYLAMIQGTTNRVNQYLSVSYKIGGKFTNIRQLYEKSFS